MKEYPSIYNILRDDVYIYAFDKLDGSNIRAEWNSKRGFYKFGSRYQLIDESSKQLGKSIPLIKEKYGEWLPVIFKEQGWKDVLCFFEYYGPKSFAGRHIEDEAQTVTLIDVNPLRHGILAPQQFIKLFKSLSIPNTLFEGHITPEFIQQVKDSTLPGMTCEGCVCKGIEDNKTIMFKIKSNAWLQKLKDYCKNDEALFKTLE